MAVRSVIEPSRSQYLMLAVAVLALIAAGCGGGSVTSGFQNPASGNGPGGTLTNPPPSVSVSISPGSASVQPNGNITFSATVQNTTNTAVDWLVDGVPGGNQTVGIITSNGAYTAPTTAPTPNSVTITAVSRQDPTKTANAVLVITAPTTTVTVTASPATVNVQTGATAVFTATVSGASNTSVTWRVNGIAGGNATVGTISPTGIYTAPATIPANPVVSISATSVSNPSASGLALATIIQRVALSLAPASVQVEVALSQQFTATVTGTTNTAVTWAVNGVVGGNATFGTISASGVYTAPAAIPATNVVTISATSQADSSVVSFASATIVASVGVNVSVSPAAFSLDINQSTIFVATVSGLFRGLPPSAQAVWHVNNLPGGSPADGTIVIVPCPGPVPPNSSCAQYTAPSAVPLPNVVVITAYSVTDPKSSATASVLITAPTSVSVSIAPPVSTVQTGTTVQFAATVSGTLNQSVVWAVAGVPGGNATVGTISSAGLYTAPAGVPPEVWCR